VQLPKSLSTRFNEVETVIAKTVEYLTIPSVVGHEEHFMTHLARDFAAMGFKIDKHDGVLAVHGDNPHSNILCAHIDRHGLISLGNGEYAYAAQYVRENKYGEPNPNSIAAVKNIEERFAGEKLYAYDDDTGKKLGEGTIQACASNAYTGDPVFTIHEMNDLKEGTALAYSRMATKKGEFIKGQIDNTISIATVYALFKNGFEGTALLTCEEEIGKSWVHISNYLKQKSIETKKLVVIDTSPFNDSDPIKEGRIVFRNRDFRESFNPDMLEKLKARARTLATPFLVKDDYLLSIGKTVEQLGSTELGRLIKHCDRRWSGTTVQIPTLAYHTSYETTSKAAIVNYYGFLHHILVDDPI